MDATSLGQQQQLYYGQQQSSSSYELPPGFRFHPTDEELIIFYLLKKVLDSGFSSRAIADIDLNKCEPWELPERAKMGEKEWYFFSLRDRKYPTGLRTNRATEAGYWKATGKDREIYSTRSIAGGGGAAALVGMKKTLVFYKGRAPKGEKTNWVMHEYRLEGKLAYHFLSCRPSKDEWVVSRVFLKNMVSTAAKKSGRLGCISSPWAETCASASPPSSSSVPPPPLLDPSTALGGDRESRSYKSDERDHVHCFSTTAAPVSFTNPGGNGINNHQAFPALQQLPFFLSSVAPPPPGSGGRVVLGGGWGASELVRRAEVVGKASQQQVQPVTELDCLWTF